MAKLISGTLQIISCMAPDSSCIRMTTRHPAPLHARVDPVMIQRHRGERSRPTLIKITDMVALPIYERIFTFSASLNMCGTFRALLFSAEKCDHIKALLKTLQWIAIPFAAGINILNKHIRTQMKWPFRTRVRSVGESNLG